MKDLHLVLTRFAHTKEAGVFGTLTATGHPEFALCTIERPWLQNRQNLSCIPLGMYKATKGNFRGKYSNLELQDVPNRFAIEVHRANTCQDVEGCIGVGLYLGMIQEQWAVVQSIAAMDRLMDLVRTTKPDKIGFHVVENVPYLSPDRGEPQ